MDNFLFNIDILLLTLETLIPTLMDKMINIATQESMQIEYIEIWRIRARNPARNNKISESIDQLSINYIDELVQLILHILNRKELKQVVEELIADITNPILSDRSNNQLALKLLKKFRYLFREKIAINYIYSDETINFICLQYLLFAYEISERLLTQPSSKAYIYYILINYRLI